MSTDLTISPQQSTGAEVGKNYPNWIIFSQLTREAEAAIKKHPALDRLEKVSDILQLSSLHRSLFPPFF